MIIDFDSIETTVTPAFRGGDGEAIMNAYFDGSNRIMKLCLKKGCSIGTHKHNGNCEIIYCISGSAKITMDGEELTLNAGQAHFCPEGGTHKIENLNDDDFIAICSIPAVSA